MGFRFWYFIYEIGIYGVHTYVSTEYLGIHHA